MSQLPATIRRLGRDEKFTVIRPTGGVRIKGRYIRNAPQEFPANGSVQQADPNTQLMLPEGHRGRETLIVHTVCELFGVDVKDQADADNLNLRGRRYEVMMVSDWSREGGFFEATVVRFGQ